MSNNRCAGVLFCVLTLTVQQHKLFSGCACCDICSKNCECTDVNFPVQYNSSPLCDCAVEVIMYIGTAGKYSAPHMLHSIADKSDITNRSDKVSRCLGAKDGDCTWTNVACVPVFGVNSPKMNTFQQYDNTSNTHSLPQTFFAHLHGPNPTARSKIHQFFDAVIRRQRSKLLSVGVEHTLHAAVHRY